MLLKYLTKMKTVVLRICTPNPNYMLIQRCTLHAKGKKKKRGEFQSYLKETLFVTE